ncbi:hypothetical protein Lser_V15G44178 [Lactuca serriola]
MAEGRDVREIQSSNRSILTSLNLKSVSKEVMTYVTQEVKDLYHLLENKISAFGFGINSTISGKISSTSSVPEVPLSQYIPALEKVATLRLLQQVS